MKSHYRSFIEFDVKAGAEQSFLHAFLAAGMLTRPESIDGFVDAELVRDGATFAVIGRWETAEAYARWQGVAQKEAPAEALKALSKTIEATRPGRLYELVTDD
ncbi:MAG: antibiotic biosynthesis monooxygenase [Parvibaculaceae bacterium]|nr:antibiotic biosynthesis monooxygenase [Parvibaculaceae bacterium]